MKQKFFIVAYDISSNKRRKKLSDYLEERNGLRINKSVFLCPVNNKTDFNKMVEELRSFNTKTDDTYIFPLCKNCMDGTIHIQHKKESLRKRQTLFIEKTDK